jgi:purine-nucleoside/S-methyl-5'-thioadenosine phosphorylase / adenosine deaminase
MPSSNRILLADPPPALTAWDIPAVVHGFCGRAGGVSTGPFASFNLAQWVGDDAAAVAENWRRWDSRYPHLRVARLIQVHGKLVHRIDIAHDGKRREGDGMVTATPGIALGIFTADCVPILMVDAERRVAGALHAGWRGTLAGIAGEGVRAMVALGARSAAIRAALGPSIGICCFEVDAALAEEFSLRVSGARIHSRAGKPGKAYLDLRAIIRDQLEREGLEATSIANVGPCTRCANDSYFSRRAAGGATSGLQMSFIALPQ